MAKGSLFVLSAVIGLETGASSAIWAGELPPLPGPGLDIPVDVDGDGVASFADVYTLNWWLASGVDASEVLKHGDVHDKLIDLSAYFAELGYRGSAGGGASALQSTGFSCMTNEAALTERMPPNSLTTNGQQPTGGTSEHARTTPSGCSVVFSSQAMNLPGANDFRQVYRLEYIDGVPTTLTHVSKSTADASADGHCFRPSVSDDGTMVVFETSGRMGLSLTTGSPLEVERGDPSVRDLEDRDIYVRNVSASTATLLSSTPAAIAADQASFFSSASGDGAFAAFTSQSTNFGGGFTPSGSLMNVFRAATNATGVEILSVAKNDVGVEVLEFDHMQTAEETSAASAPWVT